MRNQRQLSKQIDQVIAHLDKVAEMPDGEAKQKHIEKYTGSLRKLEAEIGMWDTET